MTTRKLTRPFQIHFCLTLLFLICAGAKPLFAAQSLPKKPNIVFIFADDLGWTDLACFGSGYYKTPHLDQLAKDGLKFTNAYTNAPNCAPTRACLISGQYTPRHHVFTVNNSDRGKSRFRKLIPIPTRTKLNLKVITLAQSLQKAGYHTGMYGKWHLGFDEPYLPKARGFNEAIVTRGGHFAPKYRTYPKTKIPKNTYLADFLTDNAVAFIKRNHKKPFFLYLSHYAVHTPIQAKLADIKLYKNKKPVRGHHNPTYAAMVHSLDQSVKRVTKTLADLNLTKNTIVIFYSDNGGHGGYGSIGGGTGRNITDNAPLRGGKGMLYEGGIRVPLIVRWPAVIKPNSISHTPVISVDFFPTFVDLAGGSMPANQPHDGVSIKPIFASSGAASLNRPAIFWHFPAYLQANVQKGTWRTTPGAIIRAGDYKLIHFYETNHSELYNLKNDLSEKHNLAKSNPQKAAELLKQLKAWQENVNAPIPTKKNPQYKPS